MQCINISETELQHGLFHSTMNINLSTSNYSHICLFLGKIEAYDKVWIVGDDLVANSF